MESPRLFALFLAEARELLQRIDVELLTLERTPDARGAIASAFRAMHSLKGMSATVALDAVARALHLGETRLAQARDLEELDADSVVALLSLTAAVRDAISAAEQGDAMPIALAAATDALRTQAPLPEARPRDRTRQQRAAERAVLDAIAPAPAAAWRVTVGLDPDTELPVARAAVVVARLRKVAPVLRVLPALDADADEAWDGEFTIWLGAGADAEHIERAARSAGDVATVVVAREHSTADDGADIVRTVRIPAQRLDHLLDLVGELVIARDRLQREVPDVTHSAARAAVDDASRLITQLRDAILTSRMVPLAQVFDRFPRLVRDIGHAVGKDVDLVLEGRDLEVDRSLLDEISEPLVHLLRNAVDHGIESEIVRRAAGKSPRGRVVVRARREGAMLTVTVADDGGGIARDAVADAGTRLGVADAPALALSDAGLLHLLTRPGLTTARGLSAVSGRGVGMDAVQHRLQPLGGRLELATAAGAGTAITIRLPLSVAILRALLVRVADETYAIPMSAVHHTRIHRPGDETDVQTDGAAVAAPLPVVRLRAHLGLPGTDDVSGHLVVVEGTAGRRALLVDACTAQQEIVVKPLQPVRGAAALFSGGTILADGTPSLILDINSLP